MGSIVTARIGILLAALTAGGCLPFASPPLRVRASVGPTTYAPPTEPELEPEAGSEEQDALAATQVSFALHPLQLSRKASNGNFDFGVGYQLETLAPGSEQRLLHGAELELGWYPLHFNANGTRVRFGPLATTETLALRGEPDAPFGYGASLGAALELTGFAEGSFSKKDDDGSMVAGYAAGQWALGMFASGGVRNIGRERFWMATFGISGRIPFVVGIACCSFEALSDGASIASSYGDGEDDSESSSEPRSRRRRSDGDHRPARRAARPKVKPR